MSLLLLLRSGGGAPPAQTLTAARFDNANSFFAPTVNRGTVTLTAARFDNAQTFYAANVTQTAATQNLQPGLFSNAQTFYPATLTSKVTLTAARFDNAPTFNAHTLTSRITLTPVRYDNAQAFYAAKVNQTIKPGLFTNPQTFYAPVVTQAGGPQSLLPGFWENTNQFFAPKITQFITFPNWVDPGWVEPGWVEWPHFNTNQFFGATVELGEPVQAPSRAGFEMGGRKVYIKRGKRIHIFDTVEDADAWVEAEEQAQQAIQTAKGKKKVKAKAKVYKALDEQVPHEVIRLDWLESLIAHFNIPVELPTLEARQDWLEVARIALMAQQMQDDEEVELLLLA